MTPESNAARSAMNDRMSESRFVEDIRNQPGSFAQVLFCHAENDQTPSAEAARLLRDAEKIVVTGMGASLYAAVPFTAELTALGLNATLRETGELLHFEEQTCAGSVVVLVSRSGETVELLKLAARLKDLSCELIAVTAERSSTLATSAHLVVNLANKPDGPMAIQSYTSTLLTLLLLSSRIRGDLTRVRSATISMIAELPAFLDRLFEAAPGWDTFFDAHFPVHFLGRGPSYGSALEAAMLFNETAKHPAIPMTAANFRHGHVEVVDPGFRAVLFGAQSETRDLDLALAEAIRRFGGKALVVAPGPLDGNLTVETPSVPERLRPLLEIFPMQIAAARFAARKGLPVGKLRHIQPVTHDEAAF